MGRDCRAPYSEEQSIKFDEIVQKFGSMAMDINFNLLRTFLLIAENKSFRGTSEHVHRSQSAISAQIKLLETQVGVQLFHRTTRSVHLTAAGKQLFDAAKRGMREVDAGVREVREAQALQAGHVALAATSIAAAALLPPVLARFEKLYPGVRMSVREMQAADVYASVLQGDVDFGVVPGPEGSECDFEPLLTEDICAFMPASMRETTVDHISLKELSGLPLLLLSNTTSLRTLLDQAALRARVKLTPKYECIQAQTLIAMAKTGLGVAVLPCLALPSKLPKGLRVCKISSPFLTRQVGLLTVRACKLSPTAEKLASLIRKTAVQAGSR